MSVINYVAIDLDGKERIFLDDILIL